MFRSNVFKFVEVGPSQSRLSRGKVQLVSIDQIQGVNRDLETDSMSNLTTILEVPLPRVPQCEVEDSTERNEGIELQRLHVVTLPTPLIDRPGVDVEKIKRRQGFVPAVAKVNHHTESKNIFVVKMKSAYYIRTDSWQ